MSSVWGVKPEEVTVNLQYVTPDGTAHPFWIRIKKRLTVGEDKRVQTAGWRGRTWRADADGAMRPEIQIDWQLQTFARTEVYLLDWSLTGDDGKKLPVPVREVIESLEPEVFALIEDAITAHVIAMDAEKKRKAGTPEPLVKSA